MNSVKLIHDTFYNSLSFHSRKFLKVNLVNHFAETSLNLLKPQSVCIDSKGKLQFKLKHKDIELRTEITYKMTPKLTCWILPPFIGFPCCRQTSCFSKAPNQTIHIQHQ